MKSIKIGKHVVPLWLIVVLLISGIGVGVLAYHVWNTLVIPLEVKEPLEILDYPSKLDLFPGETVEFNVTVQNHASLNYSVVLDFSLDNSTYQETYVSFSEETYTVIPGQQDLTAWISVESSAPPMNASLTIDLIRRGWLVGWTYRKSHIINPSSGAGTGYQVKITTHYGQGTDNNENVYLNNHSRTDFGDVRFTASDGTTLLSYWMESKAEENNAVFWVKVDANLSTTAQTIYVYYGKADATTTSNGYNTFVVFDDFEYSDSITNHGWTFVYGSMAGTSTDRSTHGSRSLKLNQTVGRVDIKKIIGDLPSSCVLEIDAYDDLDNSKNDWWTHDTVNWKRHMGVFTEFSTIYYGMCSGYGAWVSTGVVRTEGWHKYTIVYNGASDITLKIDDLQVWRGSGGTASGVFIRNGGDYPGHESNAFWDALRVRKYVSPEPSHGSWGK